ncbi:MAG: S1C family serine protease [Candidatus Velamenicoccus archaeovorus]
MDETTRPEGATPAGDPSLSQTWGDPPPSPTSELPGYEPEPWPGFRAGFPPPPPGPVPPVPEPAHPSRPAGRVLVAAVLGLLLVIGGIVGVGVAAHEGGPSTATSATGRGPRSASVATDARDAVVTITTFRRVFGPGTVTGGTELQPLGAGTGMILTSSGEVLTNNHVIDGAFSIRVSVPGRSTAYPASVLGVSPTQDVALIQLQGASGLPTVTLGDPSTVTVGDQVVAIGNALGRGASTTTTGTISGLDRSITARNPTGQPEHLSGLIQTDAPIVPGDSGGALVDTSGDVIGMITAGSSVGPGEASRVGFAIPVDDALGIVDQIRAGRESSTVLLGERGYLGVEVQDLDAASAAQLGVSSGVLVRQVDPEAPAAGLGIAFPAVITAIDGHAVTGPDSLGDLLHAHTPGDQVRVTWVDRQGTHTATVGLSGNGPAV